MDDPLTRFGVAVPAPLLNKFDRIIEKKGYSNRSKAICDLIRKELVENDWAALDKETVGIITIIYNHGVREIDDNLTELQHHYYSRIVSNLHVHLDAHNCLEVLVIKGMVREVKKIADKITSAKGIKHGNLYLGTLGKDI
ncbi:MAG: nickel-responsive transcriptional regulator NikR [Candidatus Omnitrophota bacterium]